VNSDIWGCPDKEELINFIRKLNGQQIKYEAIKSMGKFKEDDAAKEKINEILKSDIKILDLIESLKVDDNMKWKLLKLINNSEKWLREFLQFIEEYISQYVQVMEKYEKSIQVFNNYIEENINNSGIKFLEKILGNFKDAFLKFDDYEEIYVNTIFFNSISCGFHESGKNLHIFLGRDFEATTKRLSGENVFEKNINIFKNLCDKTRFNILNYLMDGEVYSQEIANKYGISMATVSYHMNYLASVNLVKSEKRAQKTYYFVNKDTLRESIEFLKKTFSL
jgi:DNA-binding transcriptional ArsR family regulator